jgi:hypothetical protein
MRTPVSSLATKEALRKTASACPYFSSKARAVRANIFVKAPWLIVSPSRTANTIHIPASHTANSPLFRRG